MDRRRFLLASLLAPVGARGQDFDAFKRSQRQGVEDQREAFEDYKERVRKAFERYKRAHAKAVKAHRDNLEAVWSSPERTDNRKWVEYGQDRESQRVVDFAADEIRIKVVERDKASTDDLLFSQLTDLLSEDFATAFRRNPVDQRVEKALLETPEAVAQGEPGRQLIMGDLFDRPDPGSDQVEAKAKQLMQSASRQRQDVVPGSGWANVISVPLDEGRPMDKANRFLPLVRQQAREHDLAESLVLAVMHTESSFNPMARSHIPAYGLMQIVPESAGKDATRLLHGEPKVLAPSYLYEPENNIRVGAAYLHLLYHRYMAPVKEAESRLYCAIAAYNTGASNVARTFTGNGSMTEAAKVVNGRSGKEVFRTLVRELPYEETRDYLKRVTRRMPAYSEL
ncbi:MAG: transglycosylase SLT domain-containing protein [Thiohalorhabdaceae bacterium]